MARIRTIKPDFFKHDGLYDAEQETGLPLRLAFAGLWTVCDREGRFAWRPRTIKTDVMPYDDIDFSSVLDALETHGFVHRYTVDGTAYGVIPSWDRHQAINQREAKSVIPEPVLGDDRGRTGSHVRAYEYRGVNIAPALRDTIFARDNNKCLRCGATEDLTVDHIFPRSIGGTHAPANLRTLCRACNSRRPVSGEALLKDLAIDNLSMDDMNRTCMHVQDHGEGKGREGKGKGREGEVGGAEAPTAEYAFVGRIIRLNVRDFEQWRQNYPLVTDLVGELTKADAYYADNPPLDGKWFFPVSSWLKRENDKQIQTQKANGTYGQPTFADKNGNLPGDPYYGVDY